MHSCAIPTSPYKQIETANIYMHEIGIPIVPGTLHLRAEHPP